jgi:hypothetical protein
LVDEQFNPFALLKAAIEGSDQGIPHDVRVEQMREFPCWILELQEVTKKTLWSKWLIQGLETRVNRFQQSRQTGRIAESLLHEPQIFVFGQNFPDKGTILGIPETTVELGNGVPREWFKRNDFHTPTIRDFMLQKNMFNERAENDMQERKSLQSGTNRLQKLIGETNLRG